MTQVVWNRPGLSAIAYRVGTFSSFFAAMKTRLSSADYSGLAGLRTRDTDDWTIALLDGWASIGDVLTFYQERIANEAYVATATQRNSVLELGRTVGYALRPGVAATAYLAYTMDPAADVTIPAGTLAQSTPAQGQSAQAFETSGDLHAKGAWNTLGVRTSKPQSIDLTSGPPAELYLAGTNLNLNPDDALLFVPSGDAGAVTARIRSVEIQTKQARTRVRLAPLAAEDKMVADETIDAAVVHPQKPAGNSLLDSYVKIGNSLLDPPAVHPPNALGLQQSVRISFAEDHEAIAKALMTLHPQLTSTLFPALAQATAAPAAAVGVYAFRIKALPFGANAPLQFKGFLDHFEEDRRRLNNAPDYEEWLLAHDEHPRRLWLDRFYPALAPRTWVVIDGPGQPAPVVAKIETIRQSGRAQYGISGSPAHLALSKEWYAKDAEQTIDFLRKTNVFAQSEQLALAELAVSDPIAGDTIDLDGLYDGLDSGRWLIVAGTRSDVPGAPAAELMMLSTSAHTVDPSLPGDTLHTQLTLSNKLAYQYERSSVQIFGNVVASTNGQTWKETLGSGDGSVAWQEFTLKQKPLTFVPDDSAAGLETTLQVSVNGLAWTEASSIDELKASSRGYVTETDNAQNTSVIFGDGVHGARLPTGVENVKAVYRAGIGSSGNVDAGQITLLASRPLGVKAVTNPQPARGGADPESADQGRMNVPTATASLDRIVSLSDYAAVARTFAGIAKALAVQFAGSVPLVHVTVAGAADAPISETSDLITNLSATLLAQGDPHVQIDIQPRGLVLLVLSANVALTVGAQWNDVEPAIRAALLSQFGFDKRSLAQDVYASEVVAAMQKVDGVSYVLLTTFDGVAGTNPQDEAKGLKSLGADAAAPKLKVVASPPVLQSDGTVQPAQLAIFEPSLPEAIVLQPILS
jgi:predicted phage baseplate assembly protein